MPFKPISVEEEFKKNSELKKESLTHLREWMSKQPHLPKISDLELILFLHSCFYSLEKTKVTIDTYYTVRTHVPEFFSNRDPMEKSVKEAMDVGTYVALPEPTNEGHRVIYCVLRNKEPSAYIFADGIKYFCMSIDFWLLEEGTAPGHIIVFDMEGVQLGHVGRLSPMGFKKFLFYLQEAMPVRLKGLHFINVVPFVDMILALMKPFMKKELMDVLHLHPDVASIYPFVPQRCLPKDIGGGVLSREELHQKSLAHLCENRAFLLEEEKVMRVDESLRPGKPKNAGELFGVEGSFKKLDID